MHNILIFEPHACGHRMVYVRYLLCSMARWGNLHAILATTAESQETQFVAELVDEFSHMLTIKTVKIPSQTGGFIRVIHPTLARQFKYFDIIQNFIVDITQHVSVDYIFIPFLDDYVLYSLAWHMQPFLLIPWGGIAIRPCFHLPDFGVEVSRRRQDVIQKFAYQRLLRNRGLDRLFSIDPFLEPYFHGSKVTSVPDPSDIFAVAPANTQFGLSSDAVVLLVYGYLDVRKAIDRLVRAMLDTRVGTQLTLFLAGLQCPELAVFLMGDEARQLRAQGRLVEVNRHISNGEEAAAFLRADIVWCYYPRNYSSSGALVRAGQFSRPVIATREGLVGRIVAELGMGVTVAEYDDEGLVGGLVHLLGNTRLRDELGRAGFEHFSKATPEAFGDPIVSQIAHALRQ